MRRPVTLSLEFVVPVDTHDLRVPLNGLTMRLRLSELETVAAGLGEFDASEEGDLITLVEALRRLPTNDRAPAWELSIRRFGRRKELAQAAAEIGMDVIHAHALLQTYFQCMAAVSPAEQSSAGTVL